MGASGQVLFLAWIGAVAGPPILITAWALLQRSGRFRLAWALTALAAPLYVLGVWTFLVEPRVLVTREVVIESPTWRGPPVRLGLISDTHVAAPHVDARRIQKIVARMNALSPDVVLLLGDYAGGHEPAAMRAAPQRSEILRGVAAFKGLRARYGVYAVLGNHDWWYDGPAIESALTLAGATVLENGAVAVDRPEGRLWIAGLADLESTRKQPSYPTALASLPPNEPVVVMSHWPDPFVAAPRRVALTVAGHTHCGQVNLPLVGRLVHASHAARRWGCGIYVEGGRQLYVTGGVGVSILPVRFRAPPELVVITLRGRP
ncbi:metallophosphoesterase [Caulobacter sp. DWR1-3-2b1]|uniref:metallophosphoesterase n=1 Tax=Caulobacter sp. DWR1-3-2b1 TaxID=2804670 RepID=UPI003CEC7BAE